MSYKNYGLGNFLPVACDNKEIVINFNTGVERYRTSLDVNIPMQIIEFHMQGVLFVMEHEGIRYLGLENGRIMKYRIADYVLCGLSDWDVPPQPVLHTVGARFNHGMEIGQIDEIRNRVVYFGEHLDEYVFNEPFTQEIFLPKALADSFIDNPRHLHVTLYDGSEVDTDNAGCWCLQADASKSCDRSVF